MNTTSVLHRQRASRVHESSGASSPATPTAAPPDVGDAPRPSWPTSARVLVAVLVVATVISAVAAVIGGGSDGSDDSAERRLQERIATITTERDDALADVQTLDAELAALEQQLANAQDGTDELTDEIERLEARITAVTDAREIALAEVTVLTAARDDALADAADMADELAAVRARLAAVIAERDALGEAFPIEFDVALDPAAVAGTYRPRVSNVSGTAPTLGNVTISRTSEGYLRLAVPGFVEGGLFRADGALHLVAGSRTAVAACNGEARTADVVMTLFPGAYDVDADGADVAGLTAVVTVQAPATATCPAVLTFFTADLTRVG